MIVGGVRRCACAHMQAYASEKTSGTRVRARELTTERDQLLEIDAPPPDCVSPVWRQDQPGTPVVVSLGKHCSVAARAAFRALPPPTATAPSDIAGTTDQSHPADAPPSGFRGRRVPALIESRAEVTGAPTGAGPGQLALDHRSLRPDCSSKTIATQEKPMHYLTRPTRDYHPECHIISTGAG